MKRIFCDCCRNTGHFLCGAEQWGSQEFCSGGGNHPTHVRLFLPFFFEQLKLIIKHQRKVLASLVRVGLGLFGLILAALLVHKG